MWWSVNSIVGNSSTRQLVAECNEDMYCQPSAVFPTSVSADCLNNVPQQLISMIGRLMCIIVMSVQCKAYWHSFKLNGF